MQQSASVIDMTDAMQTGYQRDGLTCRAAINRTIGKSQCVPHSLTMNVDHPSDSAHSVICVREWLVWGQVLLTFYLCWEGGSQAAAASTGASNLQECRSMQAPSTSPDQPEQCNPGLGHLSHRQYKQSFPTHCVKSHLTRQVQMSLNKEIKT